MRRGKLNKLSYTLIIISALFTVASYVSDQLVIRYENNLRIKNFDYQNLDTQIKNLETTSLSLGDLLIKSDSIINNELKQRNFMIKSLLIFESDERYRDKKAAINNIKWRTMRSTYDLFDNISDIRQSFLLIFNQEIFKDINFFSLKEFNKNLNGIYLIEMNQDKFHKIKNYTDVQFLLSNEEYHDLELEYWWDLRNFRLLYIEKLYNEIVKIGPVYRYIDETIENKILDLDILFYGQKKISTYKNYFILSGIISQIFTLFFLLLLFRNLIKQKIF